MKLPQQSRGIIERGKCYNLQAFSEITGLGSGALRSARRQGLAVRYLGRNAFIVGDDWLSYVETAGRCEK